MIEYPDLEIRNEDRLAAEAIWRVSGGLTTDIVRAQIREREQMLDLLAGGAIVPICAELTNANPSAPHTVLLEAFAWMLAQVAFRFNQIPQQNHVAFANLFGIEPRPATAAETTLRFTVAAPTGTNVTIPVGTTVSDADGVYIFETVEAKTITSGTLTGSVRAARTIAGHTLLAPNQLTKMIDSIAFVTAVTNLSAIDSGSLIETLESTLNRVKIYQQRGERIVSTADLEDAILSEALGGNGIVRAFAFVENGDFNGTKKAGYTTVVAMTKNGGNIDSIAQTKAAALLDTLIGSQFGYLVNPSFVEFNIVVNVRLTGSPSSAVVAAIERNLRNFYAPSREQFGRAIYRSEIIATIEGTAGVDRIEPLSSGQILISPAADRTLREFELAKLVNVTINVV